MTSIPRLGPRGERVAVGLLVTAVGVLALALHRRGQAWGDDFALYLDQAQSLWNGNAHHVIETNRFNVLNAAAPTFSPYGYPWVWPILLSPFVALIGLDLDRLAIVEVVLLCVTVVMFHRLVRRRMPAIAALVVTAVFGLSPSILAHTDRLLSEIPHLLAVLVTLVWLDRLTGPLAMSRWRSAPTYELVVLGLLAAVAFNVRREGVVLVGAIALAQVADRVPWRRALVPHLSFAAAVAVMQLLLPTAFLPRYPGDGFSHASDALGEWIPRAVAQHLSFGENGRGAAQVLLVVALAGGLLRLVRHARTDIALVAVPLLTVVVFARFPFGYDPRYYIQIVPFAVYALAQIPTTVHEIVGGSPADDPRPRLTLAAAIATTGVALALVAVQIWHLPSEVRAARAFDDAGLVQFGPADEGVQAVLHAVDELTPPDAIVAFMKARTMTLYTDRRAVQSSDLGVVLRRADYFAMLKGSTFSQPLVDDESASREGMSKVWEDELWILWHIDERPMP